MEVSYGVLAVSRLSKRVVLVESHRGKWGFPKGHPEQEDESEVATALRELKEETGISTCEISPADFYESEYVYEQDGEQSTKRVRLYLGYVEDEAVTPRAGEIREVRWCTYEEAQALLTFKDAKLALDSIKSLLV